MVLQLHLCNVKNVTDECSDFMNLCLIDNQVVFAGRSVS